MKESVIMRIEVKIMSKEDKIWSLPVNIEEFINDPYRIEFEWEDGSTLPYGDFLFFGGEYYYGVFINGEHVTIKGNYDE